MKDFVRITVYGREYIKPIEIFCNPRESILEALIRNHIPYRAECGGRGTCGKCKIKVIKGHCEITAMDKKIFTEDELKDGFRLSCKAVPKEDCSILLLQESDADFHIVSSSGINKASDGATKGSYDFHKEPENQKNESIEGYHIAIDLGTTTIAFSLITKTGGKVFRTYTVVNPQRAYGADVVSRIKASMEGKKELLKDLIRMTLYEGILSLLEEDIRLDQIGKVAISGNTAMGHLLMGFSCDTLGAYPFEPVMINTIITPFHKIFPGEFDIPVCLLPGISAFVGGDIVSGLYYCGFHQITKPCLFIDLGTNGEMAVGNKDSVLVASTAAGPAFEGGNISCGVGSIPGAIAHISIKDGELHYKTIGDKPAVGICGTGVIEMAAELLENHFMDETGLLADKYFEHGVKIADFTFTQKDVRELQLAKAAIRAGIEVLIKNYGISYQEIDKVYLAGGFGYTMDIKKAMKIGLLPVELDGKVIAVGNSSLAGTVKYLCDNRASEEVDKIINVSKEVLLSNDEDFNEWYIDYMSFFS